MIKNIKDTPGVSRGEGLLMVRSGRLRERTKLTGDIGSLKKHIRIACDI